MTTRPNHAPHIRNSLLTATAALVLAACATPGDDARGRTVSIQRTSYGVPHIQAPDLETLAYGVAYAHAQDNICQTAQQLVTVRGERSRYFGAAATASLGRRPMANGLIDFFMAAHMDDAALELAWKSQASEDVRAMARGYVAGYNRFLADNAQSLPADCKGQPWVRPMTLGHFYRLQETTMVQAGIGAFADVVVNAQPPGPKSASLPAAEEDVARATAQAMGLAEPTLGSNAWAFGKDSTGQSAGLLVGNPHFPWSGVNRFWQVHLTVPGRLDVMGAAIGHFPVVQIGFNKDVAWSHTVSTGKRFTVHELQLLPDDPTSYLVDGQPEKMRQRTVAIQVRGEDGQVSTQSRTLWSTRWGPVIHLPQIGLGWSAGRAFAIKDANTLNARSFDTWLKFDAARSVKELLEAHAGLGMPWINTIAADREGRALYADVSVVPDVDQPLMAACQPSPQAAALLPGFGVLVMDGSKSACDWKRDPQSPVPGLIPLSRMPAAIRSDWVHNSNDSFFYTHPAQKFEGISFAVGDDVIRRVRTRADLAEVADLVKQGPVTLKSAQARLLKNRNFIADMVLPDLITACAGSPGAPTAEARDGCVALRGWDRLNDLDSRGAHLFREFWQRAAAIPDLHRVPLDRAQPVDTPRGLKMQDPKVGTAAWDALAAAVKAVRAAGFALDAPLGQVQRPLITDEPIALHGGSDAEGVLNNLGSQSLQGISPKGLLIDYGSSYIQTVTFDSRGPVAEAVLTYGQSTNPASPHANDQMRLYSVKQFVILPFHTADIARQSLGPALTLVRP